MTYPSQDAYRRFTFTVVDVIAVLAGLVMAVPFFMILALPFVGGL
jgi:hypothetical protein